MKVENKLMIGSTITVAQMVAGISFLIYNVGLPVKPPKLLEYVQLKGDIEVVKRYSKGLELGDEIPGEIERLSEGPIRESLERITEENERIASELDKKILSYESRLDELKCLEEVKSYESKKSWSQLFGLLFVYSGFSQLMWLGYLIPKASEKKERIKD